MFDVKMIVVVGFIAKAPPARLNCMMEGGLATPLLYTVAVYCPTASSARIRMIAIILFILVRLHYEL